ncbi:MAG: LamG-like jellyroll fold domain-containing protein [Verrucomicrobiales bacterium]
MVFPKSFLCWLLAFSFFPSVAAAQDTIFEGTGNWNDDSLWDAGVPFDNSLAAVNGDCTITEDTAPQNSLNPGGVLIGQFTEGTLRVVGGTLSGAHGGNNGVFIGVGDGGIGSLIIEQGAAYRSQGGGMVVRIGDFDGGVGTVIVGGELLNYKFFELINGTLEMLPTGVNNKFNEANPSFIGADGTLSYVIDGPNVGALKKADGTNGLQVDIDSDATLKITLGGTFAVGDSWTLMSYSVLSGEFSQGTEFTNEQGYTFTVDYGTGTNSSMVLTLTSDEERPKIASFTATPGAVSAGSPVTLAWDVDKITTLNISGVGDVTARGAQGSVVVNPAETTTYTLTVDFDDVIVTQNVTVVVDALPVINSFTATPAVTAPGQESTLSWDTSGADEVSITPGIGTVAVIGSTTVMPAETTTYTITATNGTGTISDEFTLTVDAIEAALVRRYDAAEEGQSEGAWLDTVGFSNYDMKNMELVEVTDSENTSLKKAFQILSSDNDTGGDNGDGFAFTDVSFEIWFRAADLDSVRQIIFETGGGENGTSLSVDEEGIYFWHSAEGSRTIDITIPLTQINVTDDFVHAVLALDSANSKASLFVRGAAGGSDSATMDGAIGSPAGRSSTFRWSNFSSGVDGALGGTAGDPPLEVDSFFGQIALIKVYDRPLSEDEALDAFSRIATSVVDDDSDDDMLPDFWEITYFDNLDSGADDDNDADSLSNAAELAARTDPTKADTDSDGLTDGEEVNLVPATDPLVADSDGDGRTDGEEVKGNPTSDPNKVDTDGDGFSDSFEVAQGSNPNVATDVPSDPLGEPTVITQIVETLPSFSGFDGGADVLDVTFRAYVDFDAKTDPDIEVIFETGGGTIGFSLVYEEGSKLVLRAAGDGGFALATVEYSLTAQEIAAGALELTWTYDVDNGTGDQTIALFVNGQGVGSDSAFLGGDWSGTNGAGFGVAGSGFAGTGENSDLLGIDFFSGTIDEARGLLFYSDRLFTGSTLPSGEIAIINITYSGGAPTIEWTSEPGATYLIEGTATLPNWVEIDDEVESEGATTRFTDTVELPEFYYRVTRQ